MLRRLLELPEETIAERADALEAITSATHDETLLLRGLQEEDPSLRLSAARAFRHALTRHNEQLRLLSYLETSARFMTDAPIEVPDGGAVLDRVGYVTSPPAPSP
jgi:hypothetical protein